ncbi:MAG: carboxypeptidase regulatory-like domain-containing protein [Chloroflexaceae bacterium]|nr:carboxypeptidase regulatory-like domain-containing protein [Chloroflexaceae bacterium]
MKSKYLLVLGTVSLIGLPGAVLAHGATVEYRQVQAIEIDATYSGGQPMGNAQVTVYAPNNPAKPWLTGMTDPQGRFSFTPDPAQPGNWEVKVRQAGHGDLVTVPVREEIALSPSKTKESASLSRWVARGDRDYASKTQQVLLGAAGVWGFFGTALFFARRKPE